MYKAKQAVDMALAQLEQDIEELVGQGCVPEQG